MNARPLKKSELADVESTEKGGENDHADHIPSPLFTGPVEPATKGLARALLQLQSEDEVVCFLRDLCTPAEITALSERWHVAQLLDEGELSYRDIHDATGVSTTTVSRVARFLFNEQHLGYRLVLGRLGGQENGQKSSQDSDPEVGPAG